MTPRPDLRLDQSPNPPTQSTEKALRVWYEAEVIPLVVSYSAESTRLLSQWQIAYNKALRSQAEINE